MKALLIIDVQEALKLYKQPHVNETIETVNRLILNMEQQGHLIVYVRHNELGSEFEPQKELWQLHDNLIMKGDVVIDKWHHSAFYQTKLEEMLKEKNIQDVIICGFQTEYCIDATMKTGHFLNFNMTLIKEAHHTFDQEYFYKERIKMHYESQLARYGQVIAYEDFIKGDAL
jgi:nicotinamidase-related amidase